ncbi:MAG TPA: TIGR03435 family protein [Vicinamibacterales bacterium]|nr:TIGR03435 family protein [Vicinamibacterales bacterium]
MTTFRVSATAALLLALTAGRLVGQAPPPPPPPPAAVISVVTAPPPAGATVPVPPAPIDPSAPLPSFEVASVKKLPKGATITSTGSRSPGGGRITILNYPLRSTIMMAWGIRDYQVIGGESWLTTDRFTINGKAETNAPRDQLLLMLRSLLVERFNLKYHAEKRELPIYALVLAGSEWKPSARMKAVDCSAARNAPLPTGPIRPETMPCLGSMMSSTSGLRATGMTMASFASLLGSFGGLGTVHDRTGLTGTYNIELDSSILSSRFAALSSSALVSSGSENLLPSLGDGPSLGSALQDIGLKLERRREPIDALVIDSVSQPDED